MDGWGARAAEVRKPGWGRSGRRGEAGTRRLRAVLLAVLACGAGAALPSAATAAPSLTRAQAGAAALRVLDPANASAPVIVFGLPSPVAAGSYVFDGGPDSRTRQRTVHTLGGLEVIATHPRARVRRRAWLFWEDERPYTEFSHPSRLVLVDAATGRVLRDEPLMWWPVVDQSPPAFMRGDGYSDPRYRVYASPSASAASASASASASAAVATAVRAAASPGRPTAGSPLDGPLGDVLVPTPVRAASGGYPRDCLIALFDSTSPDFLADAAQWAAVARANGFAGVYSTHTLEGLARAITAADGSGCNDVLIFLGGHGEAAPGSSVVEGGQPVATSAAPSVISRWNVSVLGMAAITRTYEVQAPFLADVLQAAKKADPSLSFKLIVQSCFAGRFLDYARLRALTAFLGVSSEGSEFSTGSANGSGSAYTVRLISKFWAVSGATLAARLSAAAALVPATSPVEHPEYWDGSAVHAGVVAQPPPAPAAPSQCASSPSCSTTSTATAQTSAPAQTPGVTSTTATTSTSTSMSGCPDQAALQAAADDGGAVTLDTACQISFDESADGAVTVPAGSTLTVTGIVSGSGLAELRAQITGRFNVQAGAALNLRGVLLAGAAGGGSAATGTYGPAGETGSDGAQGSLPPAAQNGANGGPGGAGGTGGSGGGAGAGDAGAPGQGGVIYNAGTLSVIDSVLSGSVQGASGGTGGTGGEGGTGGTGGSGGYANVGAGGQAGGRGGRGGDAGDGGNGGQGGDGGSGGDGQGGAIFNAATGNATVTESEFLDDSAGGGVGGEGGTGGPGGQTGYGGPGGYGGGGGGGASGGGAGGNGGAGGAGGNGGRSGNGAGGGAGGAGGDGQGGAIYNDGGTLTVLATEFVADTVTGGDGGSGGDGGWAGGYETAGTPAGAGGDGGSGGDGTCPSATPNCTGSPGGNGAAGGAGGTGGSGGNGGDGGNTGPGGDAAGGAIYSTTAANVTLTGDTYTGDAVSGGLGSESPSACLTGLDVGCPGLAGTGEPDTAGNSGGLGGGAGAGGGRSAAGRAGASGAFGAAGTNGNGGTDGTSNTNGSATGPGVFLG